MLKRLISIAILTAAYGMGLLVSLLVPRGRRSDRLDQQRALVIGTFHNPNWYSAHITPLSQSGLGELLLIADGHVNPIKGVRLFIPPNWMCRIFSRAGAKFLYSLFVSIRMRPSLYIGYAIFPAATTALILARLFRGYSCFQLTSGALELAGGGFHAENRILSALGTPSAWVERLAHSLTRRFDLMIVRGSDAKEYVRSLGYTHQLDVITGSIEIPSPEAIAGPRDIDLIFVGRLTERKRPSRFLELTALVCREMPGTRATMVGDGPDFEALERYRSELGLVKSVALLGLRKDVAELVARSRVFVLTSRWEGVSIAMLEAMASGAIPVVNDVGDLADVVEHERNGFLVPDNEIEVASGHIVALLRDQALQEQLSSRARRTVIDRCSRSAVADRWRSSLTRLFKQD